MVRPASSSSDDGPAHRPTRWLDLSCQQLTRVPGHVLELSRLQNLNLSWNQLQTLPDTLAVELPNLREVDLAHNLFSKVQPLLVLGSLQKLIELDVSDNPLPFSGLTAHEQLARALLLLAPTGGKPERPQTASASYDMPRAPTWQRALTPGARPVSAMGRSQSKMEEMAASPSMARLPFPRLRLLSGRPVTTADRKTYVEERTQLEEAGPLRGAKEKLMGEHRKRSVRRTGWAPVTSEPWRERLLERAEGRMRRRIAGQLAEREGHLKVCRAAAVGSVKAMARPNSSLHPRHPRCEPTLQGCKSLNLTRSTLSHARSDGCTRWSCTASSTRSRWTPQLWRRRLTAP